MPNTTHYTPDIFTLVPMSALSKRHFDIHPIWSEYYDYEERDEIIAWGVDPQWLASELERVHSGHDHCAYPILRPYPLPERMRLYIRARITTVDGRTFDGQVMNEDAFALSIFINDDEYCFSRDKILDDLNRKELARLHLVLGASTDQLFPVRYETDFVDSEDQLITGAFSIGVIAS